MSARLPALGLLFAAACAAPPDPPPSTSSPSSPPAPSTSQIDVQLPLPASADGQSQWASPLDRHPRLRTARVGPVPVPGTWTVYLEFDRTDANWLHALYGEHRNVRVTWAGFEIITDGRKGYVKDVGSKERAEQSLTQLPMSAPPPARSTGKR